MQEMTNRSHLKKLEPVVDIIDVLPNDDGSYRVHVNYVGGKHPSTGDRCEMAGEIAELIYDHISKIRYAKK